MLYHASKTPGLQTLLPCRSTHEKPYVYAISSRMTSLCFGAPKDDFDLLMDEENGIPVLDECYPGAFARVYGGKSCSLYTVAEEGFLRNQTGWEAELVCPHPVPVLQEERVDDLYAALLDAAAQGQCVLHPYREDADYLDMLRDELSSRIQSYGITAADRQRDMRFVRYLNQLLRL